MEGLTDFAACEQGLLAALKHDGARWLEKLLNDPDWPGQANPPLPGEQDYGCRSKSVLTLLGWLTLWRPYYYNPVHEAGRFALDDALGLVDSYSPGVARWICRAGSLAGSYQAASQDLLTYGALEIDARQVQRLVQAMAPSIAGAMADAAGSFTPPLLLASGVALLGALGAATLHPAPGKKSSL